MVVVLGIAHVTITRLSLISLQKQNENNQMDQDQQVY